MVVNRLCLIALLSRAFAADLECAADGSCPAKGQELLQKKSSREEEMEMATMTGQLVEMVGTARFHLNADASDRTNSWIIFLEPDWTDAEDLAYATKMSNAGIPYTYVGHHGGVPVIISTADESTLRAYVRANPGPTDVVQDSQTKLIPEMPNDDRDASFLGVSSQSVGSWGLDRIDAEAGLDGSYTPPGDGTGTHVYVVDTGIFTKHEDFGGRAFPAIEWGDHGLRECKSSDTECARDHYGHGTHCAGTVGGTKYGVAKKANLYAVKVLWPRRACHGVCAYTSWAVGAMDWVISKGSKPAVMSMSFITDLVYGYLHAIDAAVRADVTVVVAAGNYRHDARHYSPSSVPSAITVGSTTSNDGMSFFSNFGSVVDIFAPGSSIVSASHTSKTGSVTESGTSMACPHVAGAVAVVLGLKPQWKPDAIVQYLTKTSSKDKISSLLGVRADGAGTTNKLLQLSRTPKGVTFVTKGTIWSSNPSCALQWVGTKGSYQGRSGLASHERDAEWNCAAVKGHGDVVSIEWDNPFVKIFAIDSDGNKCGLEWDGRLRTKANQEPGVWANERNAKWDCSGSADPIKLLGPHGLTGIPQPDVTYHMTAVAGKKTCGLQWDSRTYGKDLRNAKWDCGHGSISDPLRIKILA